ncbi:GNAT family N-acetyltransferase [Cellulomonas sp. URHE0023]|uniref:GNAT family N-acetyltransferase n=1 Tax=Cellulomonas sp. URHE0023 TaxID=1380354 RepID=UPI000555E05F|nr:GNAT family protein [Cellulomonas sp. URHE0023]
MTRPISLDDAEALTALLAENREFLAPWESVRDDGYFSLEGQREVLRGLVEVEHAGSGRAHVILDDEGSVVGRITLSGIVRGALQSCAVGYWVGSAHNGRGLATAAVGEMLQVAFTTLGLHRVQAETLLHNSASQAVLQRNGFTRFGMAPGYLKIAGRWQDHVMWQVLNPAADV